MTSILIVDDNPLDRRLAKREITKALPGAHIYEAHEAKAVTQHLQSGDINLVVTDYQLRWSTGLHVLRESKQTLPDVPVIMFTNTGTEEVAVEGMKNGLDDYVLKAPGRYAALAEAVVAALRRRREREEARRAEEARSKAKDDFLMMMAHELRGPLAPLRSALFLLKSDIHDEETRQYALQVMDRQVDHMSQLINDLLDVSRIISGKLRLNLEPMDLAVLLSELEADRIKEFRDRGINFSVELPAEAAWVMGDRTRLIQVIGNLLDNALKFTPGGQSVTLRLERVDQHVQVQVCDTGIGVEPEVLGRLFEPFVQADRSLDRSAGGLGMGLAVVKRLVELHGGGVEVRSDGPGLGTTFTLTLPRTEPVLRCPSELVSPERHHGTRSILLIEDYRDTLEMMRLLLESHGYRVRTASTGEEGLRLAEHSAPDAVLCDLGLPDLPGFGVARHLKTNPRTCRTHVVAISGYGQEEDRRRALEAGFDKHLTKPVEPEVVLSLLASFWPAE